MSNNNNDDYDENDRKIDETSKKLGKNIDDYYKQHKKEMIKLYEHELNEALRLAEECSKKGEGAAAIIHFERARHANDLIKMTKKQLNKY